MDQLFPTTGWRLNIQAYFKATLTNDPAVSKCDLPLNMRSLYVLAIGALLHCAVIKTPVSNFYASISQKTEVYTFNTVQLLNTSKNIDASEIGNKL